MNPLENESLSFSPKCNQNFHNQIDFNTYIIRQDRCWNLYGSATVAAFSNRLLWLEVPMTLAGYAHFYDGLVMNENKKYFV